ncbi:MAG TPA: undecaprenyldiphospho-muramoylpentapeptide beta-N-acetylglucosaminyltransferase, partial [Phaeodactylibacter sp.]|nr:undecaprenyldiphospho-muramoylpentapeptide beta-N-acetylglucosaminyltransferase [Phaeodactylibacter sp.]
MRVLISGGGTGGHVFPAIAIADALRALEPEVELLFVGALGKLEMERVPKAGYPIKGLWISGFHRSWRWSNLLFPLKLGSSLFKAAGILQRFKPDVAVGVGGYASGPTLYLAARKGIPTLIQEQNSFPGVTNRLLSKYADRICVAYEGMERFFPAGKILLTGNPVRAAISESKLTRDEALKHFGLDASRKTIFVVGGSLGARTFNQALAGQQQFIDAHKDVQILWQTGKLYWETYKDHPVARHPRVKALPFVDRMDLAYVAADVVVSRAGALSVSELMLAGKAVLFVPSPNVAADHQTKNAEALVRQKAARMITDAEAADLLLPKSLELLEDE